MDTDKTAAHGAGNGQKSDSNGNPSAKGFDTAPLQALQGVEGSGVGVSGGAVEGETKKKELAEEFEGDMVDDEPEAGEKPRKYTAKDDKTEIKHAAAVLLADAGMSYGAVAKAIDRHVNTVKNVVPALRKHSLASPRMASLAKKGVEAVMTGFIGKREKQPDGTVAVVTDRRVKASDMLKAAEMVQSRYDPVEQTAAPGSQTFMQINIGQYNQRD